LNTKNEVIEIVVEKVGLMKINPPVLAGFARKVLYLTNHPARPGISMEKISILRVMKKKNGPIPDFCTGDLKRL